MGTNINQPQPQAAAADCPFCGRLWMGSGSSIYKTNRSKSVITQFAGPSNDITGVDINEDTGCVWCVDDNADEIYKLNQSGSVIKSFSSPTAAPYGLDINEDTGCLWTCDVMAAPCKVIKLNQSGGVVNSFRHPSEEATGVDINESTGCVWTTEYFSKKSTRQIKQVQL